MATPLIEVTRDIPKKYLELLSTSDMQAIADGRDADVSTGGLQILDKGKDDLGLGEFLDLGGALVGAGTGALIGSSIFPGIGTAVGTVLGGAIGTFGGEVAEDVIADREKELGFQPGGAAREAALSALFDTATLGAGRGYRAYKAFRGANKGLAELGQEFKPVLDVVEAAADTPTALAQAQEFLLQKGAPSLSPLATESASMLTQIGRELGEMGIISGNYYAKDVEAAQHIVLKAFTEFSNQGMAKNAEELGKEVIGLKSAADKALHSVYGSQLESLKNLRSTMEWVSVEPIAKALREFSKKYETVGHLPFERSVTRTSLDKDAVSFVDDLASDLGESVTVPGRFPRFRLQGVIDLEKKINQEISKMTPGSPYGNGVARRQLKDLHDSLRKTTIRMMRDVDPAVAKIYQKMQREYSEGLDFLDVAAAESLIKNGMNKDAYQAIGRGLLEIGDTEKARNLLKIAERSIITKAKQKKNMDVGSELNKFREKVRASYLKERSLVENASVGATKATKNIFTESTGAVRLLENSDTMKVIFGERWPKFKKLLNHVVTMSKKRDRQTFSLALRSAEIAAGVGAAGGLGLLGAGAVGAGAAALGSAALILTSPLLLYKLASRPALVNKYIALDNQLLKMSEKASPKQLEEIVISNVGKLMEDLSEEDILDIRQSVSDPNYSFGQ